MTDTTFEFEVTTVERVALPETLTVCGTESEADQWVMDGDNDHHVEYSGGIPKNELGLENWDIDILFDFENGAALVRTYIDEDPCDSETVPLEELRERLPEIADELTDWINDEIEQSEK